MSVTPRSGGVYSDFDALLLHPLDIAGWGPTFIGRDRVWQQAPAKASACAWCLAGGNHYLAPGVMGSAPQGLLVQRALEVAFGNTSAYDPSIFNAVGPRAVTVAYRSLAPFDAEAVRVLDGPVLYPFSYWDAPALFKSRDSVSANAVAAERIRRASTSLHTYGHVTRNATVEAGSVMSVLSNGVRVLTEDALRVDHIGPDEQWAQCRDIEWLAAPKYQPLTRAATLVEGVRYVVTRAMRALSFELHVTVSAGAVGIAGDRSEESTWSRYLVVKGLTPAQLNDRLARLVVRRPTADEPAAHQVPWLVVLLDFC